MIDPKDLEREAKADADVIRVLRENGDDPSVVREVDVSFVGSSGKIERLSHVVEQFGWQVVQIVPHDEGSALDIKREQTTDDASIRALTIEALELAVAAGVTYDGWGTIATRRTKH